MMHEYRVTVGLGFGNDTDAYGAAGARAVLDDEGLAELNRQSFDHDAGGSIGGAPRGKRHHDAQ